MKFQTPAPDPFAAARKHADTIRGGLRRTVAACVALGLELIDLKARLGYQRGGDRRSKTDNPSLKWSDLVAKETGFSADRCNDFMKAARAVRERLAGSRKKGEKRVKLIVQTPPSEWTDADYDEFATHIGDAFDADTFKALMDDLGFGPKLDPAPKPSQRSTTGSQQLEQGDFYDDMMAAHDLVAQPIVSLHLTQKKPEEFVRCLYDLPLDDIERDAETGRPHIHGLRTLRHVLTTAGEEIDAAISAKLKGDKLQIQTTDNPKP